MQEPHVAALMKLQVTFRALASVEGSEARIWGCRRRTGEISVWRRRMTAL